MVTVEEAVAGETAVGREDAHRAVWVQHYPSLAGWLCSLVVDVDVAHDLAAEAFTRLLGRWRTVKDPAPTCSPSAPTWPVTTGATRPSSDG